MVQVEEEIFVSQNSRVIYNGQPCGIILADTFDLANYAATKVTISYSEDKSNMRPNKVYKFMQETELIISFVGTPIFTSLDSIIKAKNERLFTPLPDTRDAIEYGDSLMNIKFLQNMKLISELLSQVQTQHEKLPVNFKSALKFI